MDAKWEMWLGDWCEAVSQGAAQDFGKGMKFEILWLLGERDIKTYAKL